MSNKYLCTAIPYVNGKPHIGHAMDYLLADVCARYYREQGDEVRLQVGTDEHGNKVFSKARSAGIPIKEFVDQKNQEFRELIEQLDISCTDFVRTTDADHIRRCQAIWQKLSDHIYAGEYHGWYCEGCEGFVTQKEYDENHGICPDHQKPYQKISEKNYYLRISDFKEQIRTKIENQEMLILPDFRRQEILKLLDDAPDVSISRPVGELSWGVPVPGDESQVMYVWLDALSNYITVLGYPDTDQIPEFNLWWPAAAQFIGKDVLRFHAIIWPAILLGLGLDLPKAIVVHGHVLAHGQKMSKSLGNVIDPFEAIHRHGLEAFRYYFLRHVDTFADSDFTWKKFDEAYNNELANDLGNLVQRLAVLCYKNHISYQDKAEMFIDAEYNNLMQNFEFSKAFDHVWKKIQALNRAVDQNKPWELAKQGDAVKLQTLFDDLLGQLLVIARLLRPFLPVTAAKIDDIFSGGDIIPPAQPLFPKDKSYK